MSEATKSKKILELVGRVAVKGVCIDVPADLTLLETGLFCVLRKALTAQQTSKTIASLEKQHPDWNELRVCQIQEFTSAIHSRSADVSRRVAHLIKDFLQEIYQKNHGFDLEGFRADPAEAAKFMTDLPVTGAGIAHRMLTASAGGEVPITLGIVRAFDRLGLVRRTSSIRKAQQTFGALVAAEQRAAFGVAMGVVAETYCDSKKPVCWECPLVRDCPFGTRVEKDWQAQQKRLELQRAKDVERRKLEQEKERKRIAAAELRRKKEQEKRRAKEVRKRQLLAAAKAREAERRRKEAQKKAAIVAKRKEEEAAHKAAQKAAQASKKKAAAAKKAAAQKAAAAKKAAAKKAAGKKAAAKKAAAKKAAAKKAAAKKAAGKKGAGKKGAEKKQSKAGKSAQQKTVTAKSASKKKSGANKARTKAGAPKSSSGGKSRSKSGAGKASAKKPRPKDGSARKKVAQKPASPSKSAKRPGAKKKAQKKSGKKR